jgi:hypothetical protein
MHDSRLILNLWQNAAIALDCPHGGNYPQVNDLKSRDFSMIHAFLTESPILD